MWYVDPTIGILSNICMLVWAVAIVTDKLEKSRPWLFIGAHGLLLLYICLLRFFEGPYILYCGGINVLVPALVGLFVLLFRRKNVYLFYSAAHIVYLVFTILLFLWLAGNIIYILYFFSVWSTYGL